MGSERRTRTDTILLTAGLLLIGYLLGRVLLVLFAAVVISVGLDGLARALSARLPVPRWLALSGVTLGITAFIVAALAMTTARLAQQFEDLEDTMVAFVERVHTWLSNQGVLDVMEEMDNEEGGIAGSVGEMAAHAMNYGMTAVGAFTSVIVVIVLTIFLSSNPPLYRGGAVRLVPHEHRPLAEDTLSALAHSLRWWFLGQFTSMAMLGTTVGLGLYLLGIELWFALAVLTALLTFIPYVGPLVATVPIVAVGFAAGTQTGLIVLIGYLVIQNIEGNVLTPMIQHKAVNLAPALLISVQVLFSLIFGLMGLIMAAPFTVVAMVAVQKLWVEHVLGDKVT